MRLTATRCGEWWAIEATRDGQKVYTQVKRLEDAIGAVLDAFAALAL